MWLWLQNLLKFFQGEAEQEEVMEGRPVTSPPAGPAPRQPQVKTKSIYPRERVNSRHIDDVRPRRERQFRFPVVPDDYLENKRKERRNQQAREEAEGRERAAGARETLRPREERVPEKQAEPFLDRMPTASVEFKRDYRRQPARQAESVPRKPLTPEEKQAYRPSEIVSPVYGKITPATREAEHRIHTTGGVVYPRLEQEEHLQQIKQWEQEISEGYFPEDKAAAQDEASGKAALSTDEKAGKDHERLDRPIRAFGQQANVLAEAEAQTAAATTAEATAMTTAEAAQEALDEPATERVEPGDAEQERVRLRQEAEEAQPDEAQPDEAVPVRGEEPASSVQGMSATAEADEGRAATAVEAAEEPRREEAVGPEQEAVEPADLTDTTDLAENERASGETGTDLHEAKAVEARLPFAAAESLPEARPETAAMEQHAQPVEQPNQPGQPEKEPMLVAALGEMVRTEIEAGITAACERVQDGEAVQPAAPSGNGTIRPLDGPSNSGDVSVSPEAEKEQEQVPASPDDVHRLLARAMPEAASTPSILAPPRPEPAPEADIQEPPYCLPTLALLNPSPPVSDDDDEHTQLQKLLLEETLSNFNVSASVVGIVKGPSVTRFELQPAPGVKVNKITGLIDDIKLNLAAKDIRIEAPIPGRNAIGIEVPNLTSRPVLIEKIIGSEKFQQHPSPLAVALGMDIGGEPIIADIKKMPHGLIAGSTGSGKSVCINSIIVSLLYKATPEQVRLLLIDPKMVELAPYNHLPHLVTPVVTEAKQATAALKWAVEEMEKRYALFVDAGVRDIDRYNQTTDDQLPYIVIVIDELADLMMVSPQDVEDCIIRIAQKARACGIHLLLATQRPSVDVITGNIKANVPTRLAFAVFSQVDSRTILDQSGAERLLGRGDMLFLESGTTPVRLQGNFVSDDEIERITQTIKKQRKPAYLFSKEDLEQQVQSYDVGDDPLYMEALLFVAEQGQASASGLQRRFRVGYNRAARLIEMMEADGYVAGQSGGKARAVLITREDAQALVEGTTLL
ncbi:DNA translocase FtsK [Brevibacillus sp. SAFN-007a]|uniref:DNA translocase FtsK n=1 Tax=Brevibacillus sp. SAFN-007a TaxID=3436862 RepID=UPI003F819AFF